MRFKILYVFVILFSLNAFTSEAQNNRKQALTRVQFNENVNAPLTKMETSILTEAYGENLETLVLSKPQRLRDLKHLLRNRIEIVDLGKKDLSPFDLVSSHPVFKYYKEDFAQKITYQGLNFNPLKFNLNFYSKETVSYRIANTGYLLTIRPQH